MPMNNANNLTIHQKDQLIDHFFYYMESDARQRLMGELPKAYNAYCGDKIVKVISTTIDKEY